MINNNSKIFKRLRKFPGETYHIELRSEVTPVIDPPRRVSLAINKKIKDILDKFESWGAIRKVNKRTDWDNSFEIIEKRDGSWRISLTP